MLETYIFPHWNKFKFVDVNFSVIYIISPNATVLISISQTSPLFFNSVFLMCIESSAILKELCNVLPKIIQFPSVLQCCAIYYRVLQSLHYCAFYFKYANDPQKLTGCQYDFLQLQIALTAKWSGLVWTFSYWMTNWPKLFFCLKNVHTSPAHLCVRAIWPKWVLDCHPVSFCGSLE